MARRRSIKPEFWTSEQVVACSRDTRLLFIGLWNFCDDHGIHPLAPQRIKMEVFPADDISPDQVRDMICDLADHGLVDIYSVDGVEYLQVTGWQTHQKGTCDHPSFKYPEKSKASKKSSVSANEASDAGAIASVSVDSSSDPEKPPPAPWESPTPVYNPPVPSGLPPKNPDSEDRLQTTNSPKNTDEALALGPFEIVFTGKVVRLNRGDYDQWRRIYHALEDFDAELHRIDEDLAENGPQERWFAAASAKLNAKHQKILEARADKGAPAPRSEVMAELEGIERDEEGEP